MLRSCFATEIRGWARPTSRKKLYPPEANILLRNCDASSMVIDALCDWAKARNTTIVFFYFDFAAEKERSPTNVLSSLLNQVVSGLDTIPAEIIQTFRHKKTVAAGQELGLGKIVEMLQGILSSRRTFICIDALDECLPEYRWELLDSLKQILHQSPSTRIFLTGRPHIWDEVEEHPDEAVAAVAITPTKDDIIQFLRARLRKDTIPGAMDKSLEEDIIKTILGMVLKT